MKFILVLLVSLGLLIPAMGQHKQHNQQQHHKNHNHNFKHNHHHRGWSGYAWKGNTYSHLCYRGNWYGWQWKKWYTPLACWIYWSPTDGCWYRYYTDGAVYVPIDDLTAEDFE